MAEVITVPNGFTPRDYQLELFKAMDSGATRAWLRWHRRCGKDVACWAYMCTRAAREKANYFYIFPTGQMAKRALWEGVMGTGHKILDIMPPQLVEKLNHQEMRMTLKNGSTIRMLGIENEDALRGVAAKGIVFSEFAFQTPQGYKILMPVLRESKGWAIFNSTPQGKNHFYEFEMRLRDNKRAGIAKEWYLSEMQTVWPDKPNYSALISPAELETIKSDEGLSDEEIQQEYGVSYDIKAKGSIYGDLVDKAYKTNRVGNYPYDETMPVYTFWDIGRSDATCIWFAQYYGKAIFLFDYHEEEGKTVEHFATILRNKGYNYQSHILPHDGNHRNSVSEYTYQQTLSDRLESFGVRGDVLVNRKEGVKEGISALRSKFSNLHFDKGMCEEALKKLSLYRYKFDKHRQVFLKEPIHDHTSHCADSLRMLAIADNLVDGYIDDYDEDIQILSDYDGFD